MGKLLKKEERNNQFKNILSSDDRLDEQILTNVDELEPFSNHPFKLYEGERLEDMKKSISEFGILMPIIVRVKEEKTLRRKYEILSGHNRVNVAKIVGLTEIPTIVKSDISDEDALLIVTETNLIQRSFTDLSHSEKAISLKLHMEALKSQGKRTDLLQEVERLSSTKYLQDEIEEKYTEKSDDKADEIKENETLDQVGQKLFSRNKIAEKYALSSTNVARYMRLTFLNKDLLNRVDNEEMAFLSGVTISYLKEDEQDLLEKALHEYNNHKLDMEKAEILRSQSENKKLDYEKIVAILLGEFNKKAKAKTLPTIRIKPKIYTKYFDVNVKSKEVEDIIEKALEMYFENHKEEELNGTN